MSGNSWSTASNSQATDQFISSNKIEGTEWHHQTRRNSCSKINKDQNKTNSLSSKYSVFDKRNNVRGGLRVITRANRQILLFPRYKSVIKNVFSLSRPPNSAQSENIKKNRFEKYWKIKSNVGKGPISSFRWNGHTWGILFAISSDPGTINCLLLLPLQCRLKGMAWGENHCRAGNEGKLAFNCRESHEESAVPTRKIKCETFLGR